MEREADVKTEVYHPQLQTYQSPIDKQIWLDGYAAGAADERNHGIYAMIAALHQRKCNREQIAHAIQDYYDLRPSEARQYINNAFGATGG